MKNKNIHPMLFSTQMVKALGNNTKIQTRRIVKQNIPLNSVKFPNFIPNWKMEFHDVKERFARLKDFYLTGEFESGDLKLSSVIHDIKCPIVVGDIIWVRETWFPNTENNIALGYPKYAYKANGKSETDFWRPSIFMPKEACRYFLEIIGVKIEKLQDITEEDALAEGVIDYGNGTFKNYYQKKGLREIDGVECLFAKGSYLTLWDSINGAESWDSNPYVWAYEFKKVERPEGF